MSDKLALEQEKSAVQQALGQLQVLAVRDQATLTQVNQWLVEGKTRAKEIKGLEDSVNKPLNEALKANRAIYKPILDLYAQFELVLKRKVSEGSAYLAAEQARVLAEAAKAYQVAETPAAQAEATATLMTVPEAPEHSGTSIRKVWKYEVLDVNQLPGQYVIRSENRPALTAAVAAGARDIPGVRIYEDNIVTVRTK
jgi:hypothetical protein